MVGTTFGGIIVKKHFAYVVLMSAVVSGCGGGGDDAVPLADLGTEVGATMCAKMVECCTQQELEMELLGASNEMECQAFYAGFVGQLLIPVLEDSVADGRLVYDGQQMRTCLDALAAIECADLRAALEEGPAGSCDDPFTGQVALGGACANDVDCQSKLCNGDQVDFNGNVTMGTCIQIPSNGQACVDGACGPDSFCDYSGGAPTCQARLADGSGCGSNDDCASGACNGAMNGQGGTCGAPMTCNGL